MEYKDDGVTLDYDQLLTINPSQPINIKSTRRGGPIRYPINSFIYYERKRTTKKPAAIPQEILPSSQISEPVSLSNSQNEISTASVTKDHTPSKEKTSQNTTSQSAKKIIEKTKKITKTKPKSKQKPVKTPSTQKKPKLKDQKVEIEPVKEPIDLPPKLEAEPDPLPKKEEEEVQKIEFEEQKVKKVPTSEKTKPNKSKGLKKVGKPLPVNEESLESYRLINPIPKFGDRFSRMSIWEIWNHFSFDPTNPGL